MQIDRNIFLIGPRACGKTSVGRALAKRLGMEFVDTDYCFVETVGMEIGDYVESHGWDAFRDKETDVLRQVAVNGIRVVGCGGGIVLRETNREILRGGMTLYLKSDPEALAVRLMNDPNESQRPSLTGKSIVDEVREVLEEREPLYQGCADMVLGQGSVDDVVEQAVQAVKRLARSD